MLSIRNIFGPVAAPLPATRVHVFATGTLCFGFWKLKHRPWTIFIVPKSIETSVAVIAPPDVSVRKDTFRTSVERGSDSNHSVHTCNTTFEGCQPGGRE